MTDKVSLAGVAFTAEYEFPYLKSLLADYHTEADPEFHIAVTREMTEAEKAGEKEKYPDSYFESLAFFRSFCSKAAQSGVILFHSSVMEADGKAYLFAAPSGTGKTTHCRLWLETFGDKNVRILNGDKPLLRIADGVPTVYGSPFRGKENYGFNGSAPIGGICFLERCKENAIEMVDSNDAMVSAMTQLHIPENGEHAAEIIQTLLSILNSVPLWKLKCNISSEAAETSYYAMTGRNL